MKYQELILEFETNLEILESQSDDVLYKAESGISKTEKCIKKLRRRVIEKGFNSKGEEISFFKHVKPQIFSRLIYYVRLFNIESKRPRSSSKFQIKYLNNHINKLQVFFNENLDFYHYYRMGATTLDEEYFVRGKSYLRLPTQSYHFIIDEQFSTYQDATVATIIAYDMLIVYLQQEIEKLQTNTETINNNMKYATSKLFWTGSKTQLIELIYALHSSGAINSGTADIKELASMFEQLFNIELGNYYHTFIEIRARKRSKTKFLDNLTESLNKRFKDSDE
ncbi:tetracycline regulation of excision, RteC [Subsaximicrobium wynnwilliamsii]|uniref:Tetracycline regulation of excision, RteC n=1 Tax=Subsaximicrobium wynnwilliamsii TaxID=291179 RepID=A0A5C6ZBQ3_9FLAO|nr:RteC domain-containing protein [Subsaximicrobium wynnwilliamsii]TXD81530.1 tetracycline regulation of excision, RteC [Subsaximicrobium wynnwilliamsii]TXD87196.1 tetracycline regulation of excision, RteC [Subsaximicrobium wynnwilliamsii]TXE00890.1 tetracycline regulation of excision, RteC [Subsaximicrobium wynnwilliamsii]